MSMARTQSSRRGTVLVGVLILLAALGVAVLAAGGAWRDASGLNAASAQGLRLRYAMESGAVVAARLEASGTSLPIDAQPLGGASWRVISAEPADDGFEAVVEVRAGYAEATGTILVFP